MERAVALDPDFALAWAWLGLAYHHAGMVPERGSREWNARGHRATLRALELAPDLPWALMAGAVMSMQQPDWAGAERRLQRARDLSSAVKNPWTCFGCFYMNLGRTREAVDFFRRAQLIEPLFAGSAVGVGHGVSSARRVSHGACQVAIGTAKTRHLPCCSSRVVLRSVVWGISLVLIALTALPLLRSSRWWIRVWDYPRLQMGTALALAVLLQVTVFENTPASIVMLLVTFAALAWQAYSVFPYTPLHPKQSLASERMDGPNRVSVLVANVLQDNRNAAGLFDIVHEVDPDILITVETNGWWDAQLMQLKERYPFDVRRPLENTYGIHVLSKLELREVCVRELVSPGIPSVRASVRLRSGREFDLYAVHPEPPLPQKDVEERDAELLLVARESKQRRRPTLIAGDLNDVAWSHSTRLFQRISGLLDPRVGRGLFPTFHAEHRLMRWPLDHLFHDASFRLASLKVLRGFGSDHFPICASFIHDPSAVREQPAPKADASDQAEASTKITEGEEKTTRQSKLAICERTTMTHAIRITLLLCLSCWLAAPAPAQDCAPAAGLDFICGPKNAEDLVRVPGTPWIIASSMGAGARLTLIDSRDSSHSALQPQAKHDAVFASCTTPPDAAKTITHGLNLRAGAKGQSTLYVVGHGAREAIEVFGIDATGAKPTLTWKGCVPLPDGLAANSVASFTDGSLVATILIMPGKTFADSVAKRPTGAVYEWSPGKRGFELIRGSELPGNNGIEVSADGKEIFVVSSGLQTVVAYARANPTRQLRTTRPLPFTPDNVHLGEDGRLLTAGMKNDVPECGGAPGPQHTLEKLSTCPRGFIALAIDPKTMGDTLVAESAAIPAFSNATMVLTFDQQFWIGTFSGDRIAHGRLR